MKHKGKCRSEAMKQLAEGRQPQKKSTKAMKAAMTRIAKGN